MVIMEINYVQNEEKWKKDGGLLIERDLFVTVNL